MCVGCVGGRDPVQTCEDVVLKEDFNHNGHNA